MKLIRHTLPVFIRELMFNMSKLVLLDDFPDSFGGAELVNGTVANYFGADIEKASEFTSIDKDTFYIICNTSTMSKFTLHKIAKEANYIILEHDYKFLESRHPWKFDNCVVPDEQKINEDLYINAKAIFVQTDDHRQVFGINRIKGNFVSLKSSIWSDSELDLLEEYCNSTQTKQPKFCIVDSTNWIKNTTGAIDWCQYNKLDYELLRANNTPREFLWELAQYSCLIFLPVARESCCRLLVEARCLGLNTITTPNSGAWRSDWFRLSGVDLIDYLRVQSKANLETIHRTIKACTDED